MGTNREEAKYQTGVVTSLRILNEEGQLPRYEAEHVEEIFLWLNTHLPCPPFKQKGWSPDAISWFKPSALTMIAKFREIIAILEEHGHSVEMLTTDQPGMILYEDEFQIVAQSRHY